MLCWSPLLSSFGFKIHFYRVTYSLYAKISTFFFKEKKCSPLKNRSLYTPLKTGLITLPPPPKENGCHYTPPPKQVSLVISFFVPEKFKFSIMQI